MAERTRERLLQALKLAGPQSAAVLARRLGISPVAVRQHAEILQKEGLLSFEDLAAGVGRPKRLWRLSEKGHERFPDRHADLALEFLDVLTALTGTKGLATLLAECERRAVARYRQRLADLASLGERVSALAELRSEEGYMAGITVKADGSLLLIENHCPIAAAARACPSLCGSELSTFRQALGEEVEIERSEHLLEGARRCVYHVRPPSRS